jgi:hypothetical protein
MVQLGGKYCTMFLSSGVHIKLVRLIKMCLNETYSKLRIDKYLFDNIHIQNGLKQGDFLSPLIFIFALEYAIRLPNKRSRSNEQMRQSTDRQRFRKNVSWQWINIVIHELFEVVICIRFSWKLVQFRRMSRHSAFARESVIHSYENS